MWKPPVSKYLRRYVDISAANSVTTPSPTFDRLQMVLTIKHLHTQCKRLKSPVLAMPEPLRYGRQILSEDCDFQSKRSAGGGRTLADAESGVAVSYGITEVAHCELPDIAGFIREDWNLGRPPRDSRLSFMFCASDK